MDRLIEIDKNLFIIIQFVVPGLIILFLRIQFTTGRMPKPGEAALTYVVLSLIYYGVYFAVTIPFDINEKFSGNPVEEMVIFLIRIIAGPTIFGIFLGFLAQKNFFYNIALRISLLPIHPIPTAWDYKFRLREDNFVTVQLKNGKIYHGYCGMNSFMSSDPSERDFYIEKLLDNEETNSDHSLYIAVGQIETIEFTPITTGGTYVQIPKKIDTSK